LLKKRIWKYRKTAVYISHKYFLPFFVFLSEVCMKWTEERTDGRRTDGRAISILRPIKTVAQ